MDDWFANLVLHRVIWGSFEKAYENKNTGIMYNHTEISLKVKIFRHVYENTRHIVKYDIDKDVYNSPIFMKIIKSLKQCCNILIILICTINLPHLSVSVFLQVMGMLAYLLMQQITCNLSCERPTYIKISFKWFYFVW